MFDKLFKNFNTSIWIVRVFCVLSLFLCNWQTVSGLCLLMGYNSWGFAIVVNLITQIIIVLLFPIIVRGLAKLFRFYNLPFAEYSLVATAFYGLYALAFGLIQIVNFFTPLYSTWINLLGGFLCGTVAYLGFYLFTSKMYFNTATRPRYFKILAIGYVVVMSARTIFLIGGGV